MLLEMKRQKRFLAGKFGAMAGYPIVGGVGLIVTDAADSIAIMKLQYIWLGSNILIRF